MWRDGNEVREWYAYLGIWRHSSGIETHPLIREQCQESVSVILRTDGQSVSPSWNKPSIWDLRSDFYFCQTVTGLLMWGALSDKRTGLSITIAASPRQRSHSSVRVPWDSRPYFTVSDKRLPFSSPPTTRSATVEVFDPASTGLVSRKSFKTYIYDIFITVLFHPKSVNFELFHYCDL
jgi:hypothetical protein